MLLRCDARGAGGTRLVGLLKVLVPIGEARPSSRPFGLVFALAIDTTDEKADEGGRRP